MTKHSSLPRLRHSGFAALLAWLLLPAASSWTQNPQWPSPADAARQSAQPAPVRIEDAVHIVGLEDEPGTGGTLAFDDRAMTFDAHGRSTAIPLHSILSFSIVHDDKPLIRGAKGKLAENAPYGVGLAVTLSRPSAETLTLFYRDSYGALHGCILVLPKGSSERVVSALAAVLPPSDYPKSGNLLPAEPRHEPASPSEQASGSPIPSVEVALPSESVEGVPAAFAAAVFEDLIRQIGQTGLFAPVWRTGDMRRTPETMVLHIDFEGWKKGSARERGFGPFAGATEIKSSVTLEDGAGRIVFHGQVKGTKRTSGESLDVANSLAKNVRKALDKTPELQWSKKLKN